MIDSTDPAIENVLSTTKRFRFACDGRTSLQSIYMIFDDLHGVPFRVFIKRGHTGLCTQALLEAIGRLLTIILQRTDLDLECVWKTLIGITCHAGSPVVSGTSCMDALARELKTRYSARFNMVGIEEDAPCAPTD